MTPETELWYSHPTLPYDISTAGRVRRRPGKGLSAEYPSGRLIQPHGRFVVISHHGRPARVPIAQLLGEAMQAHDPHTRPPTPEEWKPIPEAPEIEVSSTGKARHRDTLTPVHWFWLRGMKRIRVNGAPLTLHNLVAELHLPDRPPEAPHASFLTPDRADCSITNLTWQPTVHPEPRPARPARPTRKRGPLTPQETYAIVARARKGNPTP